MAKINLTPEQFAEIFAIAAAKLREEIIDQAKFGEEGAFGEEELPLDPGYERQTSNTINTGDITIEINVWQHMGDQNTGQGVIGRGNIVIDPVFNQQWQQKSADINLVDVEQRLGEILDALKSEASEAEHFESLSAIAEAKAAAKDNDGPRMLEAISNVGKWAFEMATQIGVGVAVAEIKRQLGIP